MTTLSPRLALYTIAILHEPPGSSVVQGFIDRIPETFAAAEQSTGFIDRERELGDWGPVTLPGFVPEDLAGHFAQTFSLWRDVESAYAYAYAGHHAEGLKQRHQWFRKEAHPGYVCWWVGPDHRPDTAEAVARIEQLHAAGPGPDAFNFRQAFDATGAPAMLDRDAIKQSVDRNRAWQIGASPGAAQ